MGSDDPGATPLDLDGFRNAAIGLGVIWTTLTEQGVPPEEATQITLALIEQQKEQERVPPLKPWGLA